MANLLGALRFALGADTAAFERDLKGAESALQRAADAGKKAGLAISAAFVGVAGLVGAAITKAINDADRMGEIAEKIGIPVEALSRLRFAAEQSGASLESLQTGIVRLSRSLTEAASNPLSTAGRSFQALGIAVTDASGKLRGTEDVLNDLANRFAGIQEGPGKVALAMNLLGRSGAELIPLLNRGAEGIAELGRQLDGLGGTITGRVAAAASDFNDKLNEVKVAANGVALQVAANLLPQMNELSNQFNLLARNGELVKAISDTIGSVFRGLISIVGNLGIAWRSLVAELSAMGSMLRSGVLPFTQKWIDTMAGVTAETNRARAELNALLRSLEAAATGAGAAVGKLGAEVPLAVAPIITSTQAIASAMREWKDRQREVLDDLIAGAAPYIEKLKAIEAALAQDVINQRTRGQLIRRIEQENRAAIGQTANMVGSTLTAVFAKSKAAAIAQAIISTAVGISNALAGPPTGPPWPFNIAQAALIAASGAAQIASIRSTNSNGGGGGAPSVSGGGGGSAEPAQQLPSQTLTVQGIGANDLFTGDAVRGLADRLLQFQRDGGKVVLA